MNNHVKPVYNISDTLEHISTGLIQMAVMDTYVRSFGTHVESLA